MSAAALTKIVVFRGGAIGDFVLTLPVLAALRRHAPQARLEVLGYPAIASLAVAGGYADAVRPIESPSLAGFFSEAGDLDPSWAAAFAETSLFVSYLHDPDGVFERNVRRCSTAPFLRGVPRPIPGSDRHASEVLLDPLRTLGIRDADPVPRLRLGEARTHPLRLAVHPGSGSELKNWPEDHWTEFLPAWLSCVPGDVLLLAGEAEGNKARRLGEACRAAGVSAERLHLLENAPLVEVARQLSGCGLFLGHDSGPSHLAAALDVPGAVLWGPSDARLWRPRNPRLTLLQDPAGLAAVGPLNVLRHLLEARAASVPPSVEVPSCTDSPAGGSVLAIGYGNTLRSDDGAGPAAAAAVDRWSLPGVSVRIAHQLTPELAETIHRARAVVFIDARLDAASDSVRCIPLECPETTRVNPHVVAPEGLLCLAKSLYGTAPPAWLITIPIADTAFGEALSPAVARRVERAAEAFLTVFLALPVRADE